MAERGNTKHSAELDDQMKHEVAGEVVHGDHRGAQLGFPTANVLVDDAVAAPADGVYAARVLVGDTLYPAAVSVGNNPTFEGVPGGNHAMLDRPWRWHRRAGEAVTGLVPGA